MKKGIHPELNTVTARCVCGNQFETSTTESSLNVDICSNCHPFCTGTQKFIDEAGRIEKFSRKYNSAKK